MIDEPVTKADMRDLEERISMKVFEIREVERENARIALDAAWGLVPFVRAAPWWGAYFLVLATTETPWWATLAGFVAVGLYTAFLSVKVNEQRMAEIERLLDIDPWEGR